MRSVHLINCCSEIREDKDRKSPTVFGGMDVASDQGCLLLSTSFQGHSYTSFVLCQEIIPPIVFDGQVSRES